MAKIVAVSGKLAFVLGFAAVEAAIYKATDKFTPDMLIPLFISGVVLVVIGKK